jgi:hypothetical protein
MDVRYLDQKQMGIVYYMRPDQMKQMPRLEEQGPDALHDALRFDDFVGRLRETVPR